MPESLLLHEFLHRVSKIQALCMPSTKWELKTCMFTSFCTFSRGTSVSRRTQTLHPGSCPEEPPRPAQIGYSFSFGTTYRAAKPPRNLKCILPSEKSQSEKVKLWKQKKKKSVVVWSGGGRNEEMEHRECLEGGTFMML